MSERKDRNNSWTIKPCWYVDPYGNRCINSGAQVDVVLKLVNQELSKYEEEILNEINSIDGSYLRKIEDSIKEKKLFISKKEIALTRAKVAYQEGADTLDEYKESKYEINKEISGLKEEIKILELKLKYAGKKESSQRMHIIEEFNQKIAHGDLSNEELNNLYKTIIDSILWERNGDDIKIKINFL